MSKRDAKMETRLLSLELTDENCNLMEQLELNKQSEQGCSWHVGVRLETSSCKTQLRH